MAFKEAFNVVPEGEGSKMEVNTNAFKDGNELGAEAQTKLTDLQKKLDDMQETMKKDLNADELRVANMAIERELEASIPDQFRTEYESAQDWERAANAIQYHILSAVNTFMYVRLQQIIKTVDDESWTGSVSKDEVASIIRDLDPTLTPDEVLAFQDRYSAPSALEEGARAASNSFASHRRQIDEAMNAR